MDKTIKSVAFWIKYMWSNEGRISKKDADVMASRFVADWARDNVPFDQKAFYESCGLDQNKPVDGKEYN